MKNKRMPHEDKFHQEIIGSRLQSWQKTEIPVFTYQDLFEFLQTKTPEQLAQQAQIVPKGGGVTPAPINLETIICAGTVEELFYVDGTCDYEIRSSRDHKHHPEEIVLITDGHGFSEDGDTAYTMSVDEDGESILIGNVSGKVTEFFPRKAGEPTKKLSKSKIFQLAYLPEKTREELFARLEELSKVEQVDLEEVSALQAELYRRQYRI